MISFRLRLLGLVVSVMISGCATSETDAAKLSTWELLFGRERLQSHLDDKRDRVDRLTDRAVSLSTRLQEKRTVLRQLDAELAAKARRSGELSDEETSLREELDVERRKLEALRAELHTRQEELNRLRRELESREGTTGALEREVAENERAIATLGDEIAILERAIERLLLARARHGLETE